MATDVKNTDGGNTGNSQNIGRVVVRAAGAGPAAMRKKTLDLAIKPADFPIASFDLNTTPEDGTVLSDRFDDPRYYQGDATS